MRSSEERRVPVLLSLPPPRAYNRLCERYLTGAACPLLCMAWLSCPVQISTCVRWGLS
jgi:hypothetical protein